MNKEKKEVPKIIIKENGEVQVDEHFNLVTAIGLLEHELARLRVIIENNQRREIEQENETTKN